jgi:hypothetical protein
MRHEDVTGFHLARGSGVRAEHSISRVAERKTGAGWGQLRVQALIGRLTGVAAGGGAMVCAEALAGLASTAQSS